MNNQNNFLNYKGVRYFPRTFSMVIMIATLIMFTISPWEWPLKNRFLFYFINILILISIYYGYRLGANKYKIKSVYKNFRLLTLLKISLIVNLFFIYPKFLFRLKVPSISFSEIINNVAIGILDPALAYASKHQSEFNEFLTLSNPLTLIYFLTLPLQYFAIPLAIYYWNLLSLNQKLIFFLIVLTDVLSYIMIGTNKGIFDYIILVPLMLVVKNPQYLRYKDLLMMKNLKYFAVIFTVFILGIGYFVEGNKGRKNINFGYEFAIGQYANRDSFILSILPESLEDSYIAIDSYLSQGYYAMGLAIDMDFKFTYGLGHNTFFTNLGERFLGNNHINSKSYQKRMEDQFGYNSNTKWHTFYVWMANDLTFWGVVIFVFWVGYFFAQIWMDAINFSNPYAIILLPLFFTIVLYFSANNQVLGNQGSSIVFWIYFILWYRSRGKNFVFK